jgi:acetate kinase
VVDGRSVDTTMGFTPLEGPPMATRSGTVDPGALIHLLRGGLSVDALDDALERQSGITALGGLDDPLAFGVFSYRVAAAAAAMLPALGGLDALAFTAGIGEHRADVRDAVASALDFAQPFRVEVVPAREEITIARGVRSLGYDAR